MVRFSICTILVFIYELAGNSTVMASAKFLKIRLLSLQKPANPPAEFESAINWNVDGAHFIG